MSRSLLIAALTPILALAGAAQAQTPAAAKKPAAPASAAANSSLSLGGPQIPGVCLLSQEAVFSVSKVGGAATTRLQQLLQQAQQEVGAERTAIDTDVKALQAQAGVLKPADVEGKREGLAARLQALQEKANLRNREVEATRQKALSRIAVDAQPVIAEVYKAHKCGLLINRSSVLGGNMGGDLTAEVVRGLDAKITTITFDRESLAPGK